MVATAHYDHGDFGCPGRTYFGYSENVEGQLVALSQRIMQAEGADSVIRSVRDDVVRLRNYENFEDGNHIWRNNGLASRITLR